MQLAEQAAQLAEKKDAQLAAALADAAGKGCADRGAGAAPMTTLPTKRRRRTTPWAPLASAAIVTIAAAAFGRTMILQSTTSRD